MAEMKIKDAAMCRFRELIHSRYVALREKGSHCGELLESKNVTIRSKTQKCAAFMLIWRG